MIDAPLDHGVSPTYLIEAFGLLSPERAGFDAPTLQEVKEAQDLVDMLDSYLCFAEPQVQILSNVDWSAVDFSTLPVEAVNVLKNVCQLYAMMKLERTENDIKKVAQKWARTHRNLIETRAHRLFSVLSSVRYFMDSFTDKITEQFGDSVNYSVSELEVSLKSEAELIPNDLSFDDFDAFMRA